MFAENSGESFGTGSTAEALLKMADERLATIEFELNQTKKNNKILRANIPANGENQSVDSKIKHILLKPGSKKPNEIQTNFNLSFNNSFNTSFNNSHSATA